MIGHEDVAASGKAVVHRALVPFVKAAVAAGLSANEITAASLVVGFAAGIALAFDQFGWAAIAIALSSFGDALDGSVARRTRTASVGGALFDASVDRYEEFFVFAGLAVLFRSSPVLLGLTLLALVGSFMVSYGSAKAEGIGVPVPFGRMRRSERAMCLCAGVGLVSVVRVLAARFGLAHCVEYAPVVIALALIAIVANVSAVRRLRVIVVSASRRTTSSQVHARRPATQHAGHVVAVLPEVDRAGAHLVWDRGVEDGAGKLHRAAVELQRRRR
jgi:CDP-diacylglycerol--glycerol-3-phosphate 3-phosphatidyltransferase